MMHHSDKFLVAYNGKFHRVFCRSLKLISGNASRILSVRDAFNKELRPCGSCKPDLRLLGSGKSGTVHLENNCSNARRLRHNVVEFGSFTEAMDQGFRVCGKCAVPGIYSIVRPFSHKTLSDLRAAYQRIASIELSLFYAVRRVLYEEYSSGWWKEIPLDIRKKCAERKEEDEQVEDPSQCLDFVDLWKIIDEFWLLFSESLPTVIAKGGKGKKDLKSALLGLNRLRNRVMHPVKIADSSTLSEDDAFSLEEPLDIRRWRFK